MNGLMEQLRAFPDSEVLVLFSVCLWSSVNNPDYTINWGIDLTHHSDPSQIISSGRSFEGELVSRFEDEVIGG